MSPSRYATSTKKELLEDDFFVQWVIAPTAESNRFWQSVMLEYPSTETAINEAATFIRTYRTQDNDANELHQHEVWQRITASVEPNISGVKKRIFKLTPWMKAAAVFLLIFSSVAMWYNLRSSGSAMITLATTFGEIKTISLPDHSTVTINGNSSIRYKRSWNGDSPREVWIKGEGYFNVLHLNKDTLHITPSQRFIVHCDELNIEVLGTTFNVKARRGKTNVALLTGKIRIDYINNHVQQKPMIMAPGDYVEYAAKKIIVNKKLAKPTQITTWKSNEISFTDASLKEIAETLQDNFGYAVIISDPSLLTMKIEGEISVNSVTDLLDVVGTTLKVNIEQSADKHIVISK